MNCPCCGEWSVVFMVAEDGRRFCRRCVIWPVTVVEPQREPAAWPARETPK